MLCIIHIYCAISAYVKSIKGKAADNALNEEAIEKDIKDVIEKNNIAFHATIKVWWSPYRFYLSADFLLF